MHRRWLALCLFGAAALAVASAPARADQDAVQFFNDILQVTPDVSTTPFASSAVSMCGDIKGDVVVFFGGVPLEWPGPSRRGSTFSAASRPPTTPPSAATWFLFRAPRRKRKSGRRCRHVAPYTRRSLHWQGPRHLLSVALLRAPAGHLPRDLLHRSRGPCPPPVYAAVSGSAPPVPQ